MTGNTYSVTVEPLGQTVKVEPGQTILDACLRSGIYLPYQCNHGLCSTCKVAVLDGEVDLGDASPFALMDFEREEGRALACCARPLSDVTIEADIEVDPDARNCPVLDIDCTVAEIRPLARDIIGIWLDPGAAAFDFQAGQYVQLKIPGVDGERAFSLANPPGSRHLELHIRQVPGGKGTTYLHQSLKVGDRLALSGPYGRFYVRESSSLPMIFIAGGSGLSSPKSMIEDLLARGFDQKITLLHGVRQRQDLYYDDLFRALEAAHGNFAYVPVLSDPQPGDDWDGETGFVHEAAVRRFDGGFRGHKAYLCGPPPMIDAGIRALMKGRLFDRDIHTESFLTKADDKAPQRSPLSQRM
ncbi:NADH:ubiquinone reductase (Na(+)-transporting) subunit F [Zavarzinia compransoris]|uniref:Phenol hydroxylase n=1 Tax=Zavarzinia compransoris TaxID=1264899 RepID=A0A317DU87_9PROT|nr:2Fe-2S iron-sulfur cluster binding domain-containing protein [Zavarzinia compransoris]PWR17952.1 phenol hydroxylase [Zavarzinia compransoris]TDP40075.1 phenol hydroxylase P5 protein [Zavarzinia compransoris]